MATTTPLFKFSDAISLLASSRTPSVSKKLSPIERLASSVLDYLLKPGFGHKEFSYIRDGKELSLQIIKPMSTTSNPQNPILEIYGGNGVGEMSYELPIFKATGDHDRSINTLSIVLSDSIRSHLALRKIDTTSQVALGRGDLIEVLHAAAHTAERPAPVLADKAV